MATRALIGYLDTDGVTRLTTTYNHYDGYPSNLGAALKNFFDSDTLARDIAEYGYVSYIDPKTGDIEANNRQAPGRVTLPDNFIEAMDKIAEEIDAHGADYGYIWDNSKGEWITIENDGIGEMSQELEMELSHLQDKFDSEETNEAYHVGDDKEVVTKESSEINEDLIAKAEMALKGKANLGDYLESLKNDIRLNGEEGYSDYTTDEDWEEDYSNFTSINESFIRQMKYKAGIIK